MKILKQKTNVQSVVMSGKFTVISTFAGCGGSSLGYKWAGFKELLAIDYDKNAVETFKMNFSDVPIWKRDIRTVTSQEILDFCKIKEAELDILDGSPPCQGFSTAGKRQVNDLRNSLFKEFVRLIEDLKPKVFVMENVSGMIKGKMKGMFKEIMKCLKSFNYNVKCKLMNTLYYGVPQSRERLIWLGVRNDLNKEPSFPKPSNKILTIKDVLHDLGDEPNENIDHYWIDESPNGKNTKTYHLANRARQGRKYAGQQKRWIWNKPVGTITKSLVEKPYLRNSGCHPLYTRTFSPLELKRLSSFPDDFKFKKWDAQQRIGNAVMPKFMEAIARNIKENILEKT